MKEILFGIIGIDNEIEINSHAATKKIISIKAVDQSSFEFSNFGGGWRPSLQLIGTDDAVDFLHILSPQSDADNTLFVSSKGFDFKLDATHISAGTKSIQFNNDGKVVFDNYAQSYLYSPVGSELAFVTNNIETIRMKNGRVILFNEIEVNSHATGEKTLSIKGVDQSSFEFSDFGGSWRPSLQLIGTNDAMDFLHILSPQSDGDNTLFLSSKGFNFCLDATHLSKGTKSIQLNSNGRIVFDNYTESYLHSPTGAELAFVTNNTETIRMKNGNVGINSSNPGYKLEIVGNSYFNGTVGIGTTPGTEKLKVGGEGVFTSFVDASAIKMGGSVGTAGQVLRSNGSTGFVAGSIAAGDFGSQSANSFLASPSTGAGVPSFRTIAASDLPVHTHDSQYSAINHNHTGVYAPVSHGHTSNQQVVVGISLDGQGHVIDVEYGYITVGAES